jgi:hypothetical protein
MPSGLRGDFFILMVVWGVAPRAAGLLDHCCDVRGGFSLRVGSIVAFYDLIIILFAYLS